MILHNLEHRTTGGYTTFGSVWGIGETKTQTFKLINDAGDEIPQQTKITAWWPDGSVKWASHTANSSNMGNRVILCPVIESVNHNADNTSLIAGQDEGAYFIKTDRLSMRVPKFANCFDYIAEDIEVDDKLLVKKVCPVMRLEHRKDKAYRKHQNYISKLEEVEVEENGPLQMVFCFKGTYQAPEVERESMAFHIRMYIHKEETEIRFVHTFFYNGIENEHFLKGMGLRFDSVLTGHPYNRHVKFVTDRNCFHEAAVLLPSLMPSIMEGQMAGMTDGYEMNPDIEEAVDNLPVWNRYLICQDNASHYVIKKQTRPECCALDCMHGSRAPGVMAVNGENGGLLIGIKDFWEKHPSGLEVNGLNDDISSCTAWFYSPEVEAYDFRHYDTKSYQMSSYEGFEEVGASAYGIGVSSECILSLERTLPSDEQLELFADRVRKPAVFVGTPEYYHEKKAFGHWSLKKTDSKVEEWLELQLEQIFEFYKEEIDNRSWYGLFDYGDFMHTYDSVRHCWRYDMGGVAWQNTELVPTYWLWLYFLRTGKEDVFTIAEAMSRHCSEVDIYHFGPMKGIGSRHNVRHWGCSCKEPRVSMAGHHRFYYYLTGDFRMGEVLQEVRDADKSMINLPHYRVDWDEGKTFVRTGPDWAAFVSNWMTEYERTLDENYLHKIIKGIQDIKGTPLGLASGPEFEYDSENARLIYHGENENGTMHLQICMGGPEIWFEAADMLENENLKELLTTHGEFYFMDKAEKELVSNGLISNRSFSYPYFAAALGAYSASRTGNQKLAEAVWKELLSALATDSNLEGFRTNVYATTKNGKLLKEIPWIKTNFTAQWCLNVIVVLDLLREYLPENMEQMTGLLLDIDEGDFHHS